jgi:hypothetical protein
MRAVFCGDERARSGWRWGVGMGPMGGSESPAARAALAAGVERARRGGGPGRTREAPFFQACKSCLASLLVGDAFPVLKKLGSERTQISFQVMLEKHAMRSFATGTVRICIRSS